MNTECKVINCNHSKKRDG